jgi:hypothetical protein
LSNPKLKGFAGLPQNASFWEKGEKAGKTDFLCDNLSATILRHGKQSFIWQSAVKLSISLDKPCIFMSYKNQL